MTSTRRTITLVLSILGLLALPSLASASVGGQLSKASSALDNAVVAAEDHGNAAAFKASMKAAHQHTAKAERAARKASGKSKKAKLMRKVAAQYDANLDEYADLIAWVPTDLQLPVADAAAISAEARARAVEFLTRIAEFLPEPGRTAVLNAVAAFETDGDIEALLDAVMSEDVLGSVKTVLLETIGEIGTHITDVLGSLESLTGALPPEAAAAINMAIGMIESTLGQVTGLIDELFAGLLGGEGGFLGGLGGLGFGGLCDVLGALPIPLPICN